MFSNQQLTGRDHSQLISLPGTKILGHAEAIKALAELQTLAKADNQAFHIISGYRSFEQQRSIWNKKYSGELPVLTTNETVVDIKQLSSIELIRSIMLYSALPGASRHHWGTDFDIFPSAPIEDGYKVQLLDSEFNDNGIASEFNQWLLDTLPSTGFFKPYATFQKGIAAEPWHISYRPIAEQALAELSIEQIKISLLEDSEPLAGLDTICTNLPALYKQFINNICQ